MKVMPCACVLPTVLFLRMRDRNVQRSIDKCLFRPPNALSRSVP